MTNTDPRIAALAEQFPGFVDADDAEVLLIQADCADREAGIYRVNLDNKATVEADIFEILCKPGHWMPCKPCERDARAVLAAIKDRAL